MNQQMGQMLKASEWTELGRGTIPSLEKRRLKAYITMAAIDAVLVHLCFGLASLAYENVWWEARTMLAAQTLLPVFFTIALYNATYSTHSLTGWVFGARKAVFALIIAAALLNFVAFYTKSNAHFSRGAVTLGLLLTACALIAVRRMVPLAIERFWKGRTRNELVIDDGGPPFLLAGAETIMARHFDLNPASDDPFMLDRLGTLLRNQDRVVISCPPERRRQWALLLKSSGVYGEMLSQGAHDLGAVGVHQYGSLNQTTLVVSTGPLGMRARATKRLFDITVAALGLVLLAVPMAIAAVMIRLEDGGPALFKQRRLGRGNQFFDMLKFRSMHEDSEDKEGAVSTGRTDKRVTRIGAFLRSTSMDELPQLVNVLKGEMSIVGPRPHALGSRANNKFFWEVDAQYWQRHCLKPGLTGLAQVRGHRGATRQEKDLTDRLNSDLEYISGWSLQRDFQIVVQTLGVLRHENAY